MLAMTQSISLRFVCVLPGERVKFLAEAVDESQSEFILKCSDISGSKTWIHDAGVRELLTYQVARGLKFDFAVAPVTSVASGNISNYSVFADERERHKRRKRL